MAADPVMVMLGAGAGLVVAALAAVWLGGFFFHGFVLLRDLYRTRKGGQ